MTDCCFMVSEVEIKERNKSKEERWRSFTLSCRKFWCRVEAIVYRVRYLLSRSELAGHSSSEAHIHSFTCKYLLVAYIVISILRLKYCSFSLSLKSVLTICDDSPGQNTRLGSHSLLQGIFPTHASNPALPHYRRILYQNSVKQLSFN